MDKEKITEDDKSDTKEKAMPDLKDESQLVTDKSEIKKPETVADDEEDKPSELKEDTKPSTFDIKESEEEIKQIAKDTKEFPILKESITSKEEKDIDEKDKVSEHLSLKLDDIDKSKVDNEVKTDDIDADIPSTEISKQTEKLDIEEKTEEKPSPGALSMTYLEIIDKLQKDSQKDDEDQTADSKDEQPLPIAKELPETTDLKSIEGTSVEKESIKESQEIIQATTATEISSTAVKETGEDAVMQKTEKVEELEKQAPGKLEDSKVIAQPSPPHVEMEKVEETEKPESTLEEPSEKSIQKDIVESKSDDSRLKDLPASEQLPQTDDTKSKPLLESDMKESLHMTDEAQVSTSEKVTEPSPPPYTEVEKTEEIEKTEPTSAEKPIQKDIVETKSFDSSLKDIPTSEQLPETDETKSKPLLESELKESFHMTDEPHVSGLSKEITEPPHAEVEKLEEIEKAEPTLEKTTEPTLETTTEPTLETTTEKSIEKDVVETKSDDSGLKDLPASEYTPETDETKSKPSLESDLKDSDSMPGETQLSKESKEVTEPPPSHVEVKEREETDKTEPTLEASGEKAIQKDIVETKSDDSDLKGLPTSEVIPETDETKSKPSLESDLKESDYTAGEGKVSRSSDFDETGLQAELKLTDERDDSYGDESISPGEAYVDSGLEEEPVYGKLEAPEVPEYVTVTPDSAPASPKIQRDQTSQKLPADKQKQDIPEKESYQVQDETKEKNLEVESVVSDKLPVAPKEEPTFDKLSESDKISKSADGTLTSIDEKKIIDKADISIPDTSLTSQDSADISSDEPKDKIEEPSSSAITGKEFGEANILDDLLSASKSAIADIQSKLTSQVEEILTTPRKDKEETKETETIKTEERSSYESSDKDSTDSLEAKHGVEDLPAHAPEEGKIDSKFGEQELVKKEGSKDDESISKKDGPIEDKSIIETRDERKEETKEEKSIIETQDERVEEKKEEKPITKIDEGVEKKLTITEDNLITELHTELLDKKIPVIEDKAVFELQDESLEKVEVSKDIQIDDSHDESLDKKTEQTTEKTVTELKETLEDKVLSMEEKMLTELHDGSLEKKKDKPVTELSYQSLHKEKSSTDEKPTAEFYIGEPESKILTSEDKTLTGLREKGLEKREILTQDQALRRVHSGVDILLRETHITTTTEEKVSSDSEDIAVSKSTVKKAETSTIDTQKPTTSFDMVTSEIDTSKTVTDKTMDSKYSLETTAVTTTKETTVVTNTTKTTTVTSSDSSCTSTSIISEITSAKAVAEKESSAIMTSTIATMSSVEKEKDSVENGTSGTVHRMMVTASSEDGGTETELCPSPTPVSHEQELPGTSSSSTVTGNMLTSKDTISSTKETKEEIEKSTKESISKEDISKTIITSALGATNGDMHVDDIDDDIDEGGESGSDGEFGKSKKITTKTTKTTTTVRRRLELDDEIEPDDKENYEEVTTQEIGEDGRIITKTVKTTRTFVTVTQEGEDSEDSDFEDEDNIESTAAEDGSDSSRISKTTTSFTTVTKPDDNGVRSLSTDSSDKTGDADSEVVTRTTTTTVTVSKTVTGEEPDEVLTTTTTRKEITLGDGTVVESRSSSHEDGESEKKDDDSGEASVDSGKEAELSKESSPSKSVTQVVVLGDPLKVEGISKVPGSDPSIASDKDIKTEVVDGKVDDKKLLNGNEYDKEAHGIVGKSAVGDLEDISSSSLLQTSTKKGAELRTATPGSDAMSDRELDIGCGPSTPHSDISSGQVSRAATNVWESHEGRPDSRHCDSDEDDDEDEPGSPLSVTSQLAHSPPSHFDFEIGDRNTSDFDIKHSISTSVKHKEETSTQPQFTSSSMTSSFYGSLPPDPLQQLLQEQKDKDSRKSSGFTSEADDKFGVSMTSKDSAMTSSFYGSLEEEKKSAHHPDPIGAERYGGHLQEDEPLDFETAMYEHRTTRGKDLTSSSSSYHYEGSAHSSKYEQLYTPGLNGQKQKDEHSYKEFSEDYGNGNVSTGKQFEDLMNQNRETRGDKINGKGAGFGDPLDSGFHDTYGKGSTSDVPGIGMEHDPMFHHQFAAPTTSASSFPDAPKGFAQTSMGKTDDKKKDPIADWGKPLGLPAPAPPPTNNSDEVLPQNTNKGTPKKEKKVMQMKKTLMMNENNKAASGGQTGKDSKSKRPESPIKQPSSERKGSSNKEGNRNLSSGKSLGSPIYIDLTYVPHHGNSYYTTLEFFKKVRARYYVFSGTEPSREVYNALLDAKQTWEDKELEVTIIPTYDTDTLGYWVAENEDTLAKYKIDLSPSASRCTINLQDHETSCSAYRLEF